MAQIAMARLPAREQLALLRGVSRRDFSCPSCDLLCALAPQRLVLIPVRSVTGWFLYLGIGDCRTCGPAGTQWHWGTAPPEPHGSDSLVCPDRNTLLRRHARGLTHRSSRSHRTRRRTPYCGRRGRRAEATARERTAGSTHVKRADSTTPAQAVSQSEPPPVARVAPHAPPPSHPLRLEPPSLRTPLGGLIGRGAAG